MSQTNFLIGRGELLTHDIVGPRRMPGKAEVYTFAEARERLAPQFRSAAKELDQLSADACPGDFAVARLMMNPSFIARSYFPTRLLRSTGLESIGSRTVKVKPQAWIRKGQPQETTTTELFVAGKRQAFRNLSQWTETIDAESDEGDDLAHIERFAAFAPADRIVSLGGPKDRFFEVGLHLLPDEDPALIQKAFVKFAQRDGVKVHSEVDFVAGNLWFVPVEGEQRGVERLASFAFVRVIRPVPKLRGIRPHRQSDQVPAVRGDLRPGARAPYQRLRGEVWHRMSNLCVPTSRRHAFSRARTATAGNSRSWSGPSSTSTSSPATNANTRCA